MQRGRSVTTSTILNRLYKDESCCRKGSCDLGTLLGCARVRVRRRAWMHDAGHDLSSPET